MDNEIYIVVKDTVVKYIHFNPFDPINGMGQSRNQLLLTGTLTKSQVPEVQNKENKLPILHYEKDKGFYYKYIDIDSSDMTLDELKDAKIDLTKILLQKYIAQNPLLSDCHGGKVATYSIDESKMVRMSLMITSYMVLTQFGIKDQITWNETGKNCEVWTLEECVKLLAQWKPIIKALIERQQLLEIQIKECNVKELVSAINIEYRSADPRYN